MAKTTTKGARAAAPVRGYDKWSLDDMSSRLKRRTKPELLALRDYERSTKKRKGALAAIDRALDDVAETSGRRRGGSKKNENARARKRPGIFARAAEKIGEVIGVGISDIDADALLDRLAEFLEHERGGVKLYERALEVLDDDSQLERVQEFLEQTREHERVLIEMISELGGQKERASIGAELTRRRAQGLLEAETDDECMSQLAILQNLMIAEWVDHKNWQFLTIVARRAGDERIRKVLEEHVERVEDEEDEHYRWVERQVDRLSIELLSGFEEEEEEEDEASEEKQERPAMPGEQPKSEPLGGAGEEDESPPKREGEAA